jgi:hypothetical protein
MGLLEPSGQPLVVSWRLEQHNCSLNDLPTPQPMENLPWHIENDSEGGESMVNTNRVINPRVCRWITAEKKFWSYHLERIFFLPCYK